MQWHCIRRKGNTCQPTGEQFTKDLINAGGLDNIKWVFDEKKIPDNVLKAYKDALLEKIEDSLNKLNGAPLEEILAKYGKSKSVSDVIDFISDNFDKVFEVY